MLFSYNWLKQYTPELPDPHTIAKILTTHAVEVEEVRQLGHFTNIVVGRIDSVEAHPNADRLRVCQVSTGDASYSVVCGGSNLSVGMLVALAKVGSQVKWHGEGELITLAPATIRGVASEGMICASVEIGLEKQFPAKEEKEIVDLSSTNVQPGTELSALFGGDALIDIDNKSMTHRPDLFSHRGMAREMAAVFGIHSTLPTAKNLPHDLPKLTVTIEDEQSCKRYIGIEMEVTIGKAPEFMRERLEHCGIKSINNVVDITNYILLDHGQPVHAFDADKIDGGVVVRRAKKGEKITTLDHETRSLDENILVIADSTKPLAIAGIIGGIESSVTKDTTRIILEVAHFDAVVTRKASQQIGVRTDATLRWEKGPSEEMPTYSAPAAIELLQEYADAKILRIVDYYPNPEQRRKLSFTHAAVTRLVGMSIPRQQVIELLERLECVVQTVDAKDSSYTITPPWFRMDLHTKEDYIEELVRLFGVHNIPEQQLAAVLHTPKRDPELAIITTIRKALMTRGCSEVYNYSFYGEELMNKVGLKASAEHLEILNPLSDDLRYLRTSLLPRLLENVVKNQHQRAQLSFFEVGHVYFADREVRQLGIVVTDQHNAYRHVRGLAESLLQELHMPYTVSRSTQTDDCAFWGVYEGGNCMQITIGNTIAGSLGQVSSTVQQAMGIHMPVAFCLLSVPVITTATKIPLHMAALPQYPAIPLDLSLIVAHSTPWADIESVVKKHAQQLLRDITVFDVYTGKGIPEGQKSVSFRMVLQSHERTLEMTEMEALRDGIVQEAAKRFGAILRDK